MLSENWFIFNILCDKLILSYMEMDFFLNKKKKRKDCFWSKINGP